MTSGQDGKDGCSSVSNHCYSLAWLVNDDVEE